MTSTRIRLIELKMNLIIMPPYIKDYIILHLITSIKQKEKIGMNLFVLLMHMKRKNIKVLIQ